MLHHSRPSNLLVYGKTGTGKTAVTRYVVNKLQRTFIQQNLRPYFAYCNARLCGTEYRTIAEIAASLGLTVPFTGLAVSEVLSRVLSYINHANANVLFVLDEIDYLVKNYSDDLLYHLTTSVDKIQSGTLSLIGISNDLQFKEDLGARVISRLSEEELVFPPYSAEELRTILEQRAELAFIPGSCTQAAINLCAALSGSEHGDARRAVDLLRVAGEAAERDNAPQVLEKHVRAALQHIDQDRITEALRTLPFHAKILLLAIINCTSTEKSMTGTVYQEYARLCNTCSIDALTTRRTSSLLSELDTLGLISTSIVNYGRYGRTKKISTQVQPQMVTEAFTGDTLITQLLHH
jgi:archaeal cell division control protein 6